MPGAFDPPGSSASLCVTAAFGGRPNVNGAPTAGCLAPPLGWSRLASSAVSSPVPSRISISPISVMRHTVLRMTSMIERRMRRGIRRLPGLLRTLDRALVDRSVKHALALLGTILRMHRSADLRTLGGQRHGYCPFTISGMNGNHGRGGSISCARGGISRSRIF